MKKLLFAVLMLIAVSAKHSYCGQLLTQPLEFKLTSVSKHLDFIVRMQAHFPDGFDEFDNYREGPGTILIFKKGGSKPLQTISMENIFISLKQNGQPLTNSAPLYDNQGLINVGDFNFDGQEDFAVQNGNSGSYGQPSYSVYLFSPSQRTFQLSKPLSELIEQSLGFFRVDSRRRRIITLSKSGCCYHEKVEYSVNSNRPAPLSRTVEDGTRDTKYLYISHERFIDGEWKGTTKRILQRADTESK